MIFPSTAPVTDDQIINNKTLTQPLREKFQCGIAEDPQISIRAEDPEIVVT